MEVIRIEAILAQILLVLLAQFSTGECYVFTRKRHDDVENCVLVDVLCSKDLDLRGLPGFPIPPSAPGGTVIG